MAKFILNDESKINSYGFRVLNAGIELSRFNANPIMLDQHINSTGKVVGRWINLKIEGTNLVAESEFDIENAYASELAGKVERGFIKGASMGLNSESENMVIAKDGIMELTKCELFEVSICAIPSNANSITLYSKAGKPITESTFKLSILSLQKQSKTLNMDLLKSLIDLLGLPKETTEQDVLNAVEKLFKDKNSTNELKVNELITMSIQDGRITAPQKDFYLDAAKRNYEATFNALQSLQPKVSLMGMVNNKASDKEDRSSWSLEDYRKNAPKELQQNPELFNRLIENEKQKFKTI